MEAQKIFKRYEYKYMLTLEQQSELKVLMKQYMIADAFGRSTICNLYFDTPQYLLIRRSIENHVYKEKIRLRTYGQATPETNAFIELKKKYKKVVYKRRISASYEDAMQYLCQRADVIPHSQICSELDYALSLYQEIQPAMYLSYEREAFYGKDDHELRITFDQHILWRTEELNLTSPVYGRELLQPGQPGDGTDTGQGGSGGNGNRGPGGQPGQGGPGQNNSSGQSESDQSSTNSSQSNT